MKVATTPTQLLEGFPVGPQPIACQHCGDTLQEGDRATVFAARPADSDQWTIHRPYCLTCSPDTIHHPTVGYTELLAECRLGTRTDLATQQIRLVVLEPELHNSSPPTNRATDPRAIPVPNR